MMTIRHVAKPSDWIATWLDCVVTDKNSMTQRKLSSIHNRGESLDALRVAAQERGVHLLLLENEYGELIVTASAKPFTVLC